MQQDCLIMKLYYSFISFIIGPFKIEDDQDKQSWPELVIKYQVKNHELKVYLHKLEYKLFFERWYIPNRVYRVYKLFSLCPSDASLENIISRPVYIPDIGMSLLKEKYKRRLVVSSYINALTKRVLNLRKE